MAAPQLRRCKIAIPVLPVVSESAPLVSTSLAASGTAESMLSPHSAAHAEVAKARYAASKEKEKERLWAGAKRKHDSDGDDPADDNYEEDADRTSTESDDDPEVEEDEEEPSDVDSDSSSSSKQRRKKAKSKGRGKGKGKGKGKAKPLVLRGTKHLHVPSVTAVTSTVAAATVMAARAAGAAFSTAGGAIGPAGAVQATTPFSVPAAAAAAASPSSSMPIGKGSAKQIEFIARPGEPNPFLEMNMVQNASWTQQHSTHLQTINNIIQQFQSVPVRPRSPEHSASLGSILSSANADLIKRSDVGSNVMDFGILATCCLRYLRFFQPTTSHFEAFRTHYSNHTLDTSNMEWFNFLVHGGIMDERGRLPHTLRLGKHYFLQLLPKLMKYEGFQTDEKNVGCKTLTAVMGCMFSFFTKNAAMGVTKTASKRPPGDLKEPYAEMIRQAMWKDQFYYYGVGLSPLVIALLADKTHPLTQEFLRELSSNPDARVKKHDMVGTGDGTGEEKSSGRKGGGMQKSVMRAGSTTVARNKRLKISKAEPETVPPQQPQTQFGFVPTQYINGLPVTRAISHGYPAFPVPISRLGQSGYSQPYVVAQAQLGAQAQSQQIGQTQRYPAPSNGYLVPQGGSVPPYIGNFPNQPSLGPGVLSLGPQAQPIPAPHTQSPTSDASTNEIKDAMRLPTAAICANNELLIILRMPGGVEFDETEKDETGKNVSLSRQIAVAAQQSSSNQYTIRVILKPKPLVTNTIEASLQASATLLNLPDRGPLDAMPLHTHAHMPYKHRSMARNGAVNRNGINEMVSFFANRLPSHDEIVITEPVEEVYYGQVDVSTKVTDDNDVSFGLFGNVVLVHIQLGEKEKDTPLKSELGVGSGSSAVGTDVKESINSADSKKGDLSKEKPSVFMNLIGDRERILLQLYKTFCHNVNTHSNAVSLEDFAKEAEIKRQEEQLELRNGSVTTEKMPGDDTNHNFLSSDIHDPKGNEMHDVNGLRVSCSNTLDAQAQRPAQTS